MYVRTYDKYYNTCEREITLSTGIFIFQEYTLCSVYMNPAPPVTKIVIIYTSLISNLCNQINTGVPGFYHQEHPSDMQFLLDKRSYDADVFQPS